MVGHRRQPLGSRQLAVADAHGAWQVGRKYPSGVVVGCRRGPGGVEVPEWGGCRLPAAPKRRGSARVGRLSAAGGAQEPPKCPSGAIVARTRQVTGRPQAQQQGLAEGAPLCHCRLRLVRPRQWQHAADQRSDAAFGDQLQDAAARSRCDGGEQRPHRDGALSELGRSAGDRNPAATARPRRPPLPRSPGRRCRPSRRSW